MIDTINPLANKLMTYMKSKIGFRRPPKLFFQQDEKNSQDIFGKTAFYDPKKECVTVFTSGRHPKDVLRSLAHELIHHAQHERGDLSSEKCGKMTDTYAQDNQHMRNMEKEAYLLGNIHFRDWEDSCKFSISESKLLKENKKMSNTVTKESLKEMIRGILKEDPRPVTDDELAALKRGGLKTGGNVDIQSFRRQQATAGSKPGQSVKYLVTLEDGKGGIFETSIEGSEAAEHAMSWVARPISDPGGVGESAPNSPVEALRWLAYEARRWHLSPQQIKAALAKKTPAPEKVEEENEPCDTCPDNAELTEEGAGENHTPGTPEYEDSINEARFGPRNNKLFEKLLHKWAK